MAAGMNKSEYPAPETEAAISVLVELFTYLGPYQENIVLIGGWVPFFLTRGRITGEPHVGSLDVDLALNLTNIPDDVYARIEEILEKRNFKQRLDKKGDPVPHSYVRHIERSGREFDVQIDFLAPEYGGSPKSKRHQRVQGLLAHKARGSDLVFEHFEEKTIEAVLPNGAKHEVTVRIADPLACVVMKAVAFGSRAKEKDAYDLYFICKNIPNAIDRIGQELKKNKTTKVVDEALNILRSRFASVDSLGPVSVTNFLEETDDADRAMRCRDAFETIQALLGVVGEK